MKLYCPAIPPILPRMLEYGEGPGDRLISPGLPDRLLPLGEGLVFHDRQGLFYLGPRRAAFWMLPGEIIAFRMHSASTSSLALDIEGQLVWAVLSTSEENASAALPGDFHVSELGRLLARPDGSLVRGRLPIGAEPRAVWGLGGNRGVLWIDGRTVYRGRPETAITVSGSIDFDPVDLVAGPAGSALVLGAERAALVPALGPPFCFDGTVDGVGARFADDGCEAWCGSEEGILHVCARKPDRRVEAIPAGWVPLGTEVHGWELCVETGTFRYGPGNTVVTGALSTSWAAGGGLVIGPASSIWQADTAACLASPAGLWGDRLSLHGNTIAVELDRERRLFSMDGRAIPFGARLEPATGEVEPEFLHADGRIWQFGWEGSAISLVRLP